MAGDTSGGMQQDAGGPSRPPSTSTAIPTSTSNSHPNAVAGPSTATANGPTQNAQKTKKKKKRKRPRSPSLEDDDDDEPLQAPDKDDEAAETFIVDAIMFAVYKPFANGNPGCGWHYHNLWHYWPLHETSHEEPITHDLFGEDSVYVKEFWQYAKSGFEKENKLVARASTQRKGKHGSEPPAKLGDTVSTPPNLLHKWFREARDNYRSDRRNAIKKLLVKPSSAKWLARKKNAIKWIRYTNIQIAEKVQESAERGLPLLSMDRRDDWSGTSSSSEGEGTSGSLTSEEEPLVKKKKPVAPVPGKPTTVASNAEARTGRIDSNKKRRREDSPKTVEDEEERRRRRKLKREREERDKNKDNPVGGDKERINGKGKEKERDTGNGNGNAKDKPPTSTTSPRPRAWSPGLYAGGSPESRKQEEKRLKMEKLREKREQAEKKRLARELFPPEASSSMSPAPPAVSENTGGVDAGSVVVTTMGGAKTKRIVVLSDSEDEPVLVTRKKVDPKTTTGEPRAKRVDPKSTPTTGTVTTSTSTPKPAQPVKKVPVHPAVRPSQPLPAQLAVARTAQPVAASTARSAPVAAPPPPAAPSPQVPPPPSVAPTAARMQEPLFATEDDEQEQRPGATTGETSTRFGRPIWERDNPSQSGPTQKAPAPNDLPANNATAGNTPPTNTPAKEHTAVPVRPLTTATPTAAPTALPVVRPRIPASDPRASVAGTVVSGDPRRMSGQIAAAHAPRRSTPLSFKVPCHLDIKLPGMDRRAEMFVTNMTIHPTIPLADVNSLFEEPRPTKWLNITRIMSLAVVSGMLTSRTVVAHAKVEVDDGAQHSLGNRRMGHFLRELGDTSLREGLACASSQPNITAVFYSSGSPFAGLIGTPARLMDTHGLLVAFIAMAPGIHGKPSPAVLDAFDVIRRSLRSDSIHPDIILGSLGFSSQFFERLRGRKVAIVANAFRAAVESAVLYSGAQEVHPDAKPNVILIDEAGYQAIQDRRGVRSLVEHGCEFWLYGPSVPARSIEDCWLPIRVLQPRGGLVLFEPGWVLAGPDRALALAERINNTPDWSAYITIQTVLLFNRITTRTSKSDWELKFAAAEGLSLLHVVNVLFPLARGEQQKIQRLEGMQDWARATTVDERMGVAIRYSHIGYDRATADEIANFVSPSHTQISRLDALVEEDLQRRRNLPLTRDFKRMIALGTRPRTSGLQVIDAAALEAML